MIIDWNKILKYRDIKAIRQNAGSNAEENTFGTVPCVGNTWNWWGRMKRQSWDEKLKFRWNSHVF